MAKTICTDQELHQKELLHLRKALGRCNYPPGHQQGAKQGIKQQLGGS